MKLRWLVAVIASGVLGLVAMAANAPSQWEQPAAALAEQIAGILGPGQARLTIRNISTIPTGEIPAIRGALVRELKSRGVTTSEAEAANLLRVTLSENLRERLWVAEIVEGNETRVAMLEFPSVKAELHVEAEKIRLHKEQFAGPSVLDTLPCFPEPDGKPPLLAVLERRHGLAVLKRGCLLSLDRSSSGFPDGRGFYYLDSKQPQTRDPRGLLVAASDGDGFLVYFPGTACTGSYNPMQEPNRPPGEDWSLHCRPSDDPWPILTADTPAGPTTIKAFYNSARNYFTGVVTPSLGAELPPFYTAALLPRPSGAAFLFNGIDGRVQLVENDALKSVSGTRDWGSDFAALNSGCGAGTQIIASGSGEAAADSLRAYELPAQEAIPASAPLAVEGTVTALWSAPDGKSVYAVVRKRAGVGLADEYEVDRVTASCN